MKDNISEVTLKLCCKQTSTFYRCESRTLHCKLAEDGPGLIQQGIPSLRPVAGLQEANGCSCETFSTALALLQDEC